MITCGGGGGGWSVGGPGGKLSLGGLPEADTFLVTKATAAQEPV